VINILCWLWHDPKCYAQYTAEHVNRWASMVKRNVTVPHRLSCVTDQPEGIDDGIDIIPLPDWPEVVNPNWPTSKGRPQCHRRIDMWRADAAETYGERFLMMDIDCAILGNIDHILSREEDVVINGSSMSHRPYNGGMVLMTAGARPQVYDQWTPKRQVQASKDHLGSDQAWYAEILGPDEAKFRKHDGVVYYRRFRPVWDQTKILFFNGSTKPWNYHRHGIDRVIEAYYPEGRP